MQTKLAPYFYQVHESSERDGEFDTIHETFQSIEEAQNFINKAKNSEEDLTNEGFKIEKVRGIPAGEYFVGDLKWFIKDYPCAKYPSNNNTNILQDGTIFANFECHDGPGIYEEDNEGIKFLSITGTIGIIPLDHLEFEENELEVLIDKEICAVWEIESAWDINYGNETPYMIELATTKIETSLKASYAEYFSLLHLDMKMFWKESQLSELKIPEKKEKIFNGKKYIIFTNENGNESIPLEVNEYGIFTDIDGRNYDCQNKINKRDNDLLVSTITQKLYGENLIYKTYYSPGFREIGPINNPPKEWISYEINLDKISKNIDDRENSIINQIIDYGVENISYFLFKDQDKRLHVSGKFLKLFLKFRLEIDMKYELEQADNLCDEFINIYQKHQDEIYKKINNKLIKEKCNLSYEIPLSIDLSFSESTGWILVEDDWVFSK